MDCIPVRQFLSFNEAVTWNFFLRLFAIFTWISWNWIAFFILKWCRNWFVDVLGISIRKFLRFYEAVTWNFFLRLFTIFTWIAWDWITFFILEWCRNWFVDVLGISIRKFLRFYEAVTWNFFLRLFTIFTWISWDWIASFIYKCSNWCYCWGVCCRSFCSVHIFTNNCYRWSCTSKFWFWFEGYCSVCCYRISTNTWESLRC